MRGQEKMEGEAQLFFICEAGGCTSAAHFWVSNTFTKLLITLETCAHTYVHVYIHKLNWMQQSDVIFHLSLCYLRMCTSSFLHSTHSMFKHKHLNAKQKEKV